MRLFHYTQTPCSHCILGNGRRSSKNTNTVINSSVWDQAILPQLFFLFPVPEWWWKWKSHLYVYFDKVDIVEHLCFVLHRILKMFHQSVCVCLVYGNTAMLSFISSFNKSFIPLPHLWFLAFVNSFTFYSCLLVNHLLILFSQHCRSISLSLSVTCFTFLLL